MKILLPDPVLSLLMEMDEGRAFIVIHFNTEQVRDRKMVILTRLVPDYTTHEKYYF